MRQPLTLVAVPAASLRAALETLFSKIHCAKLLLVHPVRNEILRLDDEGSQSVVGSSAELLRIFSATGSVLFQLWESEWEGEWPADITVGADLCGAWGILDFGGPDAVGEPFVRFLGSLLCGEGRSRGLVAPDAELLWDVAYDEWLSKARKPAGEVSAPALLWAERPRLCRSMWRGLERFETAGVHFSGVSPELLHAFRTGLETGGLG